MESGCEIEQTSGKYEYGIMAGDLDSLLAMFEKAETSLSLSTAEYVPLKHTEVPFVPEEENTAKSSEHLSTLYEVLPGDVVNCDCQSSKSLISNEISIKNRLVAGRYHANCSAQTEEIPCRTFSSNLEKENLSTNPSFEKWETASNPAVGSSADMNGAKIGIAHESKTRPDISDSKPVPSSSSADVDTLKKDDSGESSSEWDDDFPSDEKCSDSSSSPDTPCRGHGTTVRRDGPRRQQGRGRVKPAENETLYDRLPSYYTLFSRPNRMATGIVRSTRSCVQLVLNSELASRERDSSPNGQSQVYDKVPAYQSCFTNSTLYDDTESRFNLDREAEFGPDEDAQCGRGHGSGSTYVHSETRFRSRSRLRARVGPRSRRSGRATFEMTDITRPGDGSKSEHSTQKQHRRILYIGRIAPTLTAEQLEATFEIFGQIEKCTVHFRECGDNYGFVTYVNTRDAYNAVEGGTRLQGCEHFDICFGGRRNFCRADYFDLDGNVEMEEELAPVISKLKQKGDDFDDLLMDELLKRKLQ